MAAARSVDGWQAVGSPRGSRSGSVTAQRHGILVADRRATSRLGMCAALVDDDFVIVAEVANAADAVAAAIGRRPDACVMDLSIPGGGLTAAHSITARLPTTGIVVLSEHPSKLELRSALGAGAAAYLPRSLSPARLCAAVHAVVAGDAVIPREMLGWLLRLGDRRPARTPRRLAGQEVALSPREWETVDLMHQGLATRDIAAELGISVVTVRRHVSDVIRKLGAPDRATALLLLEASREFPNAP